MKTMRHLLAAIFMIGSIASAQPDGATSRRIAAAGDATTWPGSSTVVIYDSTDVDVRDTGLSEVLIHRLVKVLTTAGARELRSIAIGYDPLSATVDVRMVRIHRKDGRVEVLPASRVYDYPAPARAIYWGAREKLVEVGRLEVGDAVETIVYRKGFTYALLANPDDDDRFIPPMRGHFYDIVEFWSPVPMLEKVYRVAMPKDKPLQYEAYHGELQTSVLFHPEHSQRVRLSVNPDAAQHPTNPDDLHPTHGMPTRPGKITHTFTKRNIPAFKNEPGMVAHSDVALKLLLSTSPDWYAKAVWFHTVNEEFGSFDVTPELQALTDSLLRGVTGEREKIAVLNHWAAEEIRYSGISMGQGEGYILHPGSMTLADRCGVCKDKAGILVAMLRAAGFESYPAMTMAGSRIDRIPADQFNHSVTVVKLSSGEWMLLDPTWIPSVREMWSSAEQQQEVLLGIPGGADLMTTPISPAQNHYWRLNGNSKLTADGTLEGELTLEAEGQSDAAIRRAYVRSYRSSWTESLHRMLAAVSPAARILESEIHDPYDLSRPMRIRVSYRIPGYATMAGSRMVLVPLLARNPFTDAAHASELSIDTLASRKYGFRLRCSKLVEITERMTLPPGYGASALPVFAATSGSTASFNASYRVDGGVLSATAVHRMEKRQYEASEWPEFRGALVERLRFMTTPIVLEK